MSGKQGCTNCGRRPYVRRTRCKCGHLLCPICYAQHKKCRKKVRART